MGTDGTLDMFAPLGPPRDPSRVESMLGLVGRRDRAVYAWVLARGSHGATRAEIAAGMGILDQSLGNVMITLVDANLIQDTGDKRPTPSGRPARIFVAVE